MKNHHAWIIALSVLVAVALILYANRLGDDDEITRQVFDALTNLPAVDTGTLQIEFEKGVVTLTGQLPDQESKRAALDEVGKIRGVDRVVDEIEIVADAANDSPAVPDEQDD